MTIIVMMTMMTVLVPLLELVMGVAVVGMKSLQKCSAMEDPREQLRIKGSSGLKACWWAAKLQARAGWQRQGEGQNQGRQGSRRRRGKRA